MMKRHYKANGKLLITGEYAVLDGAEALVLPIRYGQKLTVKYEPKENEQHISWTAREFGNEWFTASFSFALDILSTNNLVIARRLRDTLETVILLQPALIEINNKLSFETDIEFNRNWGFGTSSTLLALLSKWAGIDPMTLHNRCSSGSGYDIEAAIRSQSFIYQGKPGLHKTENIQLSASAIDAMFFVYLGKKQNTRDAISAYRAMNNRKIPVPEISELTRRFVRCTDKFELMQIIDEHERILSDILRHQTLKESRFPDFEGAVKSLGAWGGDFALFVTDQPREYLINYLKNKSLHTVFTYNDLAFIDQVVNTGKH